MSREACVDFLLCESSYSRQRFSIGHVFHLVKAREQSCRTEGGKACVHGVVELTFCSRLATLGRLAPLPPDSACLSCVLPAAVNGSSLVRRCLSNFGAKGAFYLQPCNSVQVCSCEAAPAVAVKQCTVCLGHCATVRNLSHVSPLRKNWRCPLLVAQRTDDPNQLYLARLLQAFDFVGSSRVLGCLDWGVGPC